MTSLAIARRRPAVRLAGFRTEALAFAVVTLAAMMAAAIAYFSPANAAGNSVSIQLPSAKTAALVAATSASPTQIQAVGEKAKLIKYPGHDEWTELFDLASDPYETKNLAADPAAKELLAAMQAEFDRQAAAVEFRVPEYADPQPR